ncbi:hypothetical protein CMsap09_01065 [Clavibacter michiganensis]|uniref:Uncharacterized protein n=1 Tax=Clavibacter michiganensis TaxID=28447 RepID=A0A251XPR9_9MICO|nr:hypothetical protein CMsap09_01065 [Clavibacter michiganensis]
MDDDDDRAESPVSHWLRRSTPEEDREREDVRTSTFIFQFYAVIPLMVVAAFLPQGPVRSTWVVLVVGGSCVWIVLRATRASRRRRAAERADADPDDAAPAPSAAPPAAPGD